MAFGETSRVSRRKFLRNTTAISAAAITGRGVYSVLDQFINPTPAYAATVVSRDQEQYLVQQLPAILDNGVTVVVPPVYNDVFTAKLARNVTWDKAALQNAQRQLEAALVKIETPLTATADGLTFVIAWGLPYFRTSVNGQWQAKAPRDLTLPKVNNQYQLAVLDAVTFPSDPGTVKLEDNHVLFKIRSNSSKIVQDAETQLFADPNSGAYIGDLFDLTSKRIGFLGRGFNNTTAGTELAQQAGIAGAESIPPRAQLSLGFTSTQTAALGPDNIPSFETLRGVTDQFPSGYFAHGAAMHLSHLELDLETWYKQPYEDRVAAMMSAGTQVPKDHTTVTIPNGPAQVSTLAQVQQEAATYKRVGHNSALQTATRLGADVLDNYGRLRRKGTAVPAREDFNTIDNPFAWYRDENWVEHTTQVHKVGLHFAVFVPSSGKFHTARNAMDGVLPDKKTNLRDTLALDKIGFNSIMKATHRQNFVLPPRAHRSFPLVELL
jgi:hypothetical protein